MKKIHEKFGRKNPAATQVKAKIKKPTCRFMQCHLINETFIINFSKVLILMVCHCLIVTAFDKGLKGGRFKTHHSQPLTLK